MAPPRPSRRRSLVLLALAATALVGGDAPGQEAVARSRPERVVVFGIDGADWGEFRRLRAEGRLPNFDALAKRGTCAPLATTNPAQSPVSWAATVTGSNPGKTLIFDFIRRDPNVPGKLEISLASRSWTVAGLPGRGMRILLPVLLGIATGLAAWGIVRLLLRLVPAVPDRGRRLAGMIAGLVLAGTGGAATHRVLRWIPERMPVAVNNRAGVPFWSALGEAGVKSVVVEAPVTFPADRAANLRLLSGLGTPDLQATWGFYSVFTDDPKANPVPETGGFVDCLVFDGQGVARSRVYGPPDITLTKEQESALDHEERMAEGLRDMKSPIASARRFEERRYQHADRAGKGSCVLEVRRDPVARTATVRLGSGGPKAIVDLPLPTDPAGPAAALPAPSDTTIRWSDPVVLNEGTWSDYVAFDFVMNPVVKVRGLGKFWLESAGGEGKVFRLLLTPISFDPRDVPPNVDIAFPRDFAPSLAAKAGLYTTLGWPCLTNPVKDDLLTDEAFLQHARSLTEERRRKLKAAMEEPDWRFLFVMFSELDRVQHAFWRHVDAKSPRHDPAAAKRYAGAIDEFYVAMDGVLGDILKQAGPEAAVLVMSDHGFAPFRRSVNLNTWLRREGFLVGSEDRDLNVGQLFGDSGFFRGTDWERSKAYAIGLGGIYLNLKGREKQGSVDPKDRDAVCASIRQALLALRDDDGSRAVHEVYLGKDLYRGPSADRWAPDLVVGFEKGWRVSWQTTLGGGGEKVIEDNRFPWSGDHCSVDPSLVPGILVSTERLGTGGAGVMDVAPTVLDLFGVKPSAEWDGRSLLPR